MFLSCCSPMSTNVSCILPFIVFQANSLRLCERPPSGDAFKHPAGDANAPGLCKVFETGSNVDAVAIDAGLVKDDVTLVDAYAELHEATFFYIRIALRHRPLDCHCTLGGVHHAAKLGQDTVTGGINDAAAVLLNHGDHHGLMLLEAANRVGFIHAHRALYPAMSAARIA